MKVLLAVAALLVLAACAAPPDAPRCAAGTRPMLVTQLFFGRSLADGSMVTDRDWEAFVADTMSRQFPGFTATDAVGQWRGASDRTVESERTKFVLVAQDDTPAARAAVEAVIAAYKTRFHQQAVGLLMDRRCGDFGS